MTSRQAVEITDLDFSYGGAPALRDVSLTLNEGEGVYIVGPNGGGKTTLLKLMLGLLQPSKGAVRVLGETPSAARRRIGYAPQHTRHDAAFPVNALDVVLMAQLNRSFTGHYNAEDRAAALAALDALAAADLAQRPFAALSGGQRQRVLIARALCAAPRLLLLDEATAGVDIRSEALLFDLLTRLKERMTVVLVSHDLGFVHEMFDRVVLVNRTVRSAAVCDVNDELIEQVYGAEHRIIHYHGHHHSDADDGGGGA